MEIKFDAFGECLEQFSKEELAYIVNYSLAIMDDHVKNFSGKDARIVAQLRIATLEMIRKVNDGHMERLDEEIKALEEKRRHEKQILEALDEVLYNKLMS